jgi:hypothetical protein
MLRFTGILFFYLAVCFSAAAQRDMPLLERSITISFTNERLDAALKKIGDQGGFTFSYNASLVESSKLITYNFRKKTVREILDILFKGALEYKIRSNHIILTKAKESSKENDEKILSGYVIDEATGERLKNVSVYDPVTLTSAVTDSYGYFEIRIDDAANAVNLSVNKQNYADTVVAVSSDERRLLNIPIRIDKQKWLTVADSVGERIKRFWNNKIFNPRKPNVVNIRDTLYRSFQFSLVPYVGTNHLLSGNVINDFSLNLFGGYGLGVKKLEVGGLFNTDRADVKGWQLAGLFNVVGGTFRGGQFAGLFNANFSESKGAQFAGLANVNWVGSANFSAAGLLNFTRLDSRGVHLAGLSNLTVGNQSGGHAAGSFNLATRDSGPMQLAGLFNFTARDVKGAQVAGVFNFAGRNVKGTQVAPVLNFTARHIEGSQVSALLNYATKVKGVQLGLVNIADSVKGVSFGIFSFVLRGYHKIEFSADEIFYTNAAFRTGVNKFYNIFTAGAKPKSFEQDQTYWTFGYGVGTAPKITRWLYLNLDVTANQIVTERNISALNLLNKLYLGLDLQAAKHLSFTFGATLNSYITENSYDGYKPLFTDYHPKIFHNKDYSNDLNMKMWLGAKVGVRFL